MKKMLAGAALTALSLNAFAADYSDGDIHKNDYKWMQFNLMYALNQLPQADGSHTGHDYLEMEFGGRSGIVDLYGYLDVFNLTNNEGQDMNSNSNSSKMFLKLAPRFSLDAMTGKDLSFGPVQEMYISTLFNVDGKIGSGNGLYNTFWGVGADVMVPWLGKTGMNLYGLYDANESKWDGYQFSMNWFKPFKFFENGSFLSFQGYVDYQWGIDEVSFGAGTENQLKTDKGGAAFFGLYWHSDRYSVGYGLKGFKDVYGLKDGGVVGDATGWGHYFAITYKI
ncbi:outer membrane protein OmpK [Ferrimonas sp. YFM]|uniref:nucleoside-specific channel-forming Tsx family protein n=1 Tax=Ferrimonas sp. YFM TaxID=3028878 RepID=UPI00257407F8|nr:outer membrane protein OmpK [Ferrimonas sp. YFM]